jgi:hypothetical protein
MWIRRYVQHGHPEGNDVRISCGRPWHLVGRVLRDVFVNMQSSQRNDTDTLKMLAFGVFSVAFLDFFQMGGRTAMDSMKKFFT